MGVSRSKGPTKDQDLRTKENIPTSRLVRVKLQNAKDKEKASSLLGERAGYLEKNQKSFGFLKSNTVSEVNRPMPS